MEKHIAGRADSSDVRMPFTSVEDAIARRGESDGIQYFDDLVAAHPAKSATDLAKFVLRSLGVAESAQKANGVRTRYGNDVQAIAARVREARKRASGDRPMQEAGRGGDRADAWAADVVATARRNQDYMAALMRALENSGH